MENNILLGGCPVKTSGSQISRNRFENLIVPLGIHITHIPNEVYVLQDNEECSTIHDNNFNHLLYSVCGFHDLGKVHSNNKTKKKQKK